MSHSAANNILSIYQRHAEAVSIPAKRPIHF